MLACMNRPHKVDGTSFDAWVRIVKELAHGAPAVDAQLWLYAPGDEAGASLRTRALAAGSPRNQSGGRRLRPPYLANR